MYSVCSMQLYHSLQNPPILNSQCLLRSADILLSFLAAQRLLREGLASYTTLPLILRWDQLDMMQRCVLVITYMYIVHTRHCGVRCTLFVSKASLYSSAYAFVLKLCAVRERSVKYLVIARLGKSLFSWQKVNEDEAGTRQSTYSHPVHAPEVGPSWSPELQCARERCWPAVVHSPHLPCSTSYR